VLADLPHTALQTDSLNSRVNPIIPFYDPGFW
jgi:hypothetical protein